MASKKNTSITLPDDLSEILSELYDLKKRLVSYSGQRPIESKNDLMISCMARGAKEFVEEINSK